MYHCLVAGGFAFLAMSEEAAGRRMPFAFLDDAAARFLERYGAGGSNAGASAAAYALNDEFAPVLAQRMDFYASDAAADAIARVRGEVEGVKGVMVENIARVLERGERLDLLVERTELLSGEALAFRRGAARARRVMWWQNVKTWFVMGGVVAGVVMVIVMAACGVTFSRCG
jgi:vesicle-associated membrane protein 7